MTFNGQRGDEEREGGVSGQQFSLSRGRELVLLRSLRGGADPRLLPLPT